MSDQRLQAIERLQAAAEKAKRGRVPFPNGFVRSTEAKPPLARLVGSGGGRGGEVRLKLYVTITMLATAPPYNLDKSARTALGWAQMLGLDPEKGPRKVNSALKWLAENKLINLEQRPVLPPVITLLAADGNGASYTRPKGPGEYFSVPVELWTTGWIVDLSATGVAVLVILHDLLGGVQHDDGRYASKQRREQYGVSDSTWTIATKELVAHGLIDVVRQPAGNENEYYKRRSVYNINERVLRRRSG